MVMDWVDIVLLVLASWLLLYLIVGIISFVGIIAEESRGRKEWKTEGIVLEKMDEHVKKYHECVKNKEEDNQ